MEYIKINFSLEPDNELHREILIFKLGATGCESFAETESGVEAYIPSTFYSENPIDYDLYFKDNPFIIKYAAEKILDHN
jgi:ribosomal protein L11 methyltransferase